MKDNFLTFGIFIGIILTTFLTAFLVSRFFTRLIEKSTEEMKNDPTNYQFLKHAVSAMIYTVGFSVAIYSVPQLKTLAQSLLAGAGILAVAVGFASQHAMSNIVSGLFVVIFKPFRVNDRLTVKGLSGVVEDITLRHTVIRDYENKRILIPNAVISDEVIVNSDFAGENICNRIEIGISYDSDIDLAKEIMRDEVMKHPLHVDARSAAAIEAGDPEVPVRVLSLGEYSVNIRAWAWAKDAPDAFEMGCDLFESIKKRFDREGVEIPFPYRTLVHKNAPPKS